MLQQEAHYLCAPIANGSLQYVFHPFRICSGGNEAADVFRSIRVPCGFIEGKENAFFFDRFHGVVWMMW